MKLTEEYFFPTVTDEGAEELYRFAESILYKAGRKIPLKDLPDIKQEMVLKCLEKLPSFDRNKGILLGGYLYWQCRGVISVWANKHWRELPASIPIIEAMKVRKEIYNVSDPADAKVRQTTKAKGRKRKKVLKIYADFYAGQYVKKNPDIKEDGGKVKIKDDGQQNFTIDFYGKLKQRIHINLLCSVCDHKHYLNIVDRDTFKTLLLSPNEEIHPDDELYPYLEKCL